MQVCVFISICAGQHVKISLSRSPVPQTPEAVIRKSTWSPSSWSGFVVVPCTGLPLLLPLKTVKVGILNVFKK